MSGKQAENNIRPSKARNGRSLAFSFRDERPCPRWPHLAAKSEKLRFCHPQTPYSDLVAPPAHGEMIISRLDAVLILTGFTLAVFSLSAGAVPAPARNLVLRSSDGPTPFRFLHLTDLHIDPDYKENSSTYSQCHRVPSQWRKGLAQHYGMVGTDCDAPMALAKESLDFVRVNWGREAPQEQKASFVVWTGDSARHDRDPSSPMTNKLVLDHNQVRFEVFLARTGLSLT